MGNLGSTYNKTEDEVEKYLAALDYLWLMTNAGLECIAEATQVNGVLKSALEFIVCSYPRRKDDVVIQA